MKKSSFLLFLATFVLFCAVGNAQTKDDPTETFSWGKVVGVAELTVTNSSLREITFIPQNFFVEGPQKVVIPSMQSMVFYISLIEKEMIEGKDIQFEIECNHEQVPYIDVTIIKKRLSSL